MHSPCGSKLSTRQLFSIPSTVPLRCLAGVVETTKPVCMPTSRTALLMRSWTKRYFPFATICCSGKSTRNDLCRSRSFEKRVSWGQQARQECWERQAVICLLARACHTLPDPLHVYITFFELRPPRLAVKKALETDLAGLDLQVN